MTTDPLKTQPLTDPLTADFTRIVNVFQQMYRLTDEQMLDIVQKQVDALNRAIAIRATGESVDNLLYAKGE